jgi:hypothetical protein
VNPEQRHSRRTFIKRAAQLGGAALGVEGLLAACQARSPAGAAGRAIAGMYSQRSVNVCYSPMKVTSSEAAALERAKRGVYLRKGPSFSAEAVIAHDGHEVLIAPGRHYGRQSEPHARSGACGAPPPRPAVDGWVWGYDLHTRKSGWLPGAVGGRRYSQPDPAYGTTGSRRAYLFGPNGKDFDCRFPAASQAASRHGYDCSHGAGIGSLQPSGHRLRTVADFGSRLKNCQEDFYLRLALGSVAFEWMAPGDRVTELYHRLGRSYGIYTVQWCFVEVRNGAFTPPGTRGWMLQSGLRAS